MQCIYVLPSARGLNKLFSVRQRDGDFSSFLSFLRVTKLAKDNYSFPSEH